MEQSSKYIIARNPNEGLTLMSIKNLTEDDVNCLLNFTLNLGYRGAAWQRAVRDYTMIVLMVDAGLRVGELVELMVTDLYFNLVPVTTLVIRAKIAKTKIERSIPMTLRSADALKLFAKECPYLFDVLRLPFAFADRECGTTLSTRQVERIVRSLALASLGRPVHPHMLRHTFATRLMRVTNIRTVQELLGHKHLSSTQIYTHPDENDKKTAIEQLNEYVKTFGKELENLAGLNSVSD